MGYGHTSAAGQPKVARGSKITRADAEEVLKRDVVKFEKAVLRHVKWPLSQNEFDALVSFCYNVGEGNFSKSSVVRVINAGRKYNVGAALSLWVKAGGKTVKGLVRRRGLETKLFNGTK
jgi:lysozyme